jgi:hypothetical protein
LVTDYGMDEGEVRIWVLAGERIFFLRCHPDQLCGPPSLLPNGSFHKHMHTDISFLHALGNQREIKQVNSLFL